MDLKDALSRKKSRNLEEIYSKSKCTDVLPKKFARGFKRVLGPKKFQLVTATRMLLLRKHKASKAPPFRGFENLAESASRL